MNIENLEKISQMMEENQFWQLVESSLKNSKNQEEQEVFLINEIAKLTPQEMIGFRLRTGQLLSKSYKAEIWCAGYLINGGCSDDGFEYFRNWIISRGKAVYEKALIQPDSLLTEIHNFDEIYEFETFWYVAIDAFLFKTGTELYEYIDYEKFKERESNYPELDFNWNEEIPKTMKAICPKISDKFWD